LRKTLAWKAYDPLMSLFLELMAVLWMMSRVRQFTFINLSFSPAPDDTVSNLYNVCVSRFVFWLPVRWLLNKSFATGGHLIVYYRWASRHLAYSYFIVACCSTTAAWGWWIWHPYAIVIILGILHSMPYSVCHLTMEWDWSDRTSSVFCCCCIE
jgi:hypothetical protein